MIFYLIVCKIHNFNKNYFDIIKFNYLLIRLFLLALQYYLQLSSFYIRFQCDTN